MAKQYSDVWLIPVFLWVVAALFLAGILNNVPSGSKEDVSVPICLQTENGVSPLVARKVASCAADQTTYGVPFPAKRVYTLQTPQKDAITGETTTTVTRYVGLGGEEMTMLDDSVRRYGETALSWNYITLLFIPYIIVGIVLLIRKSNNSDDLFATPQK